MDPIAAQNVDLARAVQALLVRQGVALEGSTLMALLGQDVEMLFQAATPEGAKLQLPSGQTVTAQGELPYPEGTRLRVRILPAAAGDTSLRLQLQEARPPAPPALLSPLLQSEAQTLATRLGQEPPPPELAPLLKLLSVLADVPVESPGLPTADRIQAALRSLPEPLQTSLGRVLDAGGLASPKELTAALLALMKEAQTLRPAAPSLLEHGNPEMAPTEAGGLERLIQHVTARLQAAFTQRPDIPEGHRDALLAWVRSLLQKAEAEPAPPGTRDAPPPAHPPTPRSSLEAPALPALPAALQPGSGSKAELPESWEAWIRGTVQTLSDPAASPREAPFHALQAKEGTAFFEIPVPWAQAGPLQIWVESDAPDSQGGGRDTTKRVLLGLAFSCLGETRLGLAQGAFGLQIRVWTQHPELLEAERGRMEDELKDLGKAVNLRIFALTYGPDGTIPSLRSVVTGPSLSALG